MKKFSYKSSNLQIKKKGSEFVATIISPQNEKETETFFSEEDAKYWLISKAEYYDRQAYDYMY
jgi:hypothetical protein